MSIRYKFLLILSVSQILLVIALTTSFAYLLQSVKNIPQTQRAEDLSRNFQRELEFKEEKLRLLLEEITFNSQTRGILERGIADRNVLSRELPYLQQILKRYGLSIFEIGDNQGKVLFRVHRPKDFGDDKKNQPIIRNALNGQSTAALEDGHSGLGFRLAAPLFGRGTILIGQVVDDNFTKTISKDNRIHLAIFQAGKVKTIGSDMIRMVMNEKPNLLLEEQRFHFQSKPYYLVKIPYVGNSESVKQLVFHVMIDENEVESKTWKIWSFFVAASLILCGVIFLISFLFSRDMVEAIKLLTTAMVDLDQWKPETLPTHRSDEIGQMGRVFVEMKEELSEHQNHLEEMVNQRTRELNETLSEMQKLQDKQDGDYFLTSLLIKPLRGSFSKSETVSIKIFERQMKQFKFRNKQSEIGGDLSVSDSIFLMGKKYTVFLNADAMGKSIQGAGGALVMGTVFKSIITRTQKLRYMQDRHPERWLKECFQEVHNVFISFDGHMLLSAILGLVDEETGTLYYINAEHPWIVLYRDGNASFLENEHSLRKIGFTEMSGDEVVIQIYPLRPGDVLILGSDGRDDLFVGQSGGNRLINDDETVFLRHVTEGGGDLNLICKAMLQFGDLTDDLSLMRIAFLEEVAYAAKESTKPNVYYQMLGEGIQSYRDGEWNNAIFALELALDSEPDDLYCLRELSKLYMKSKDYEKAIELANRYLQLNPGDTDFLFYIAYAHKQRRDFILATDFAERLRFRDPKNFNNLLLLAEILMHRRDIERSKEVLLALQEMAPENPKLLKLKNFWKKMVATSVG
ncbi:SpoIIE family protein phosphatase [Leptospira meyeri]|uniref:SpoIIE family protein phosphatase n=1 Tax=Leptospira meyeri TaxID=29508 RepID=UPI000C2ACC9C|nr:SpoIIE family protein phosphatase [Leptospira meyeri]PJZ79325.1 stage II sporulation protein E [Leptospira meyeri]PJZ95129.1 stage II sporulation protein E [Leptospira meyeri]PKA12142.1 stage II sporulation protein E [Leptospira meyeri]TGL12326.1 HAMP domain-containing protein [Leptospira meyeri]TGM24298.1 HAMP domain-containing protein [Leptospira meyeri]